MIELLPFTERDFETLISWTSTEEDLYQFAGPIFSYPLTNDQLHDYIDRIDLQPFKIVLTATKETIGHCELNFENGNHRLSRIIIGKPDLRGQKIGEQVVRKMTQLFFEDAIVSEVDLNVFDWNKSAIACYEKVGFKINPKQTKTILINNKKWTLLNMILKKNKLNV